MLDYKGKFMKFTKFMPNNRTKGKEFEKFARRSLRLCSGVSTPLTLMAEHEPMNQSINNNNKL